MSDVSLGEAVGDHLGLDVLTETTDTHGNNGVVLGVWLPGTASDLLASTAALPDADGCAFQAVGTTEGWLVSFVLGDFHFLDDFTEGSTVTGSVFTDNTDLLGSLGHISSRFFVC